MSENRVEILNKLFHQIILASELLDNLQTDRKSVAENFAFGGELSTNSEYSWRHCLEELEETLLKLENDIRLPPAVRDDVKNWKGGRESERKEG